MSSRRNVRYSALPDDDNDDKFGVRYDPRFDYTPGSFDRVPWKSIFLAIFLLFLGCVLLSLSIFIFHWSHGRREGSSLWSLSSRNYYLHARTKEGMVSQRFLAFLEA
ncbi:C20ORF30 PROTEIN [Salix koriyanagi]|uniref:C20ORF30 PROTEIN n=1 Tax=Salix koriyanagi TaxID=2511006 RepID=A0A9Q0VEV0_9ROSI|nr:C20ORF30 PROTEIN [Salix koriyanagi]